MTRRFYFGELRFTSDGYAGCAKLPKPLRSGFAIGDSPGARREGSNGGNVPGRAPPPSPRGARENALVQMKSVDRLSSAAATNVPTPPKSMPSRSSSRRMPIRSIVIVQAIKRTP